MNSPSPETWAWGWTPGYATSCRPLNRHMMENPTAMKEKVTMRSFNCCKIIISTGTAVNILTQRFQHHKVVFSCLTSRWKVEVLPFIIWLMELICSTEASVPRVQPQCSRSVVKRWAKKNLKKVAVFMVLVLISHHYREHILCNISVESAIWHAESIGSFSRIN